MQHQKIHRCLITETKIFCNAFTFIQATRLRYSRRNQTHRSGLEATTLRKFNSASKRDSKIDVCPFPRCTRLSTQSFPDLQRDPALCPGFHLDNVYASTSTRQLPMVSCTSRHCD